MIELGSKVKCVVTGLEGIVTAQVFYSFSETKFGVQAKANDGVIPDLQWLSETQLRVVGKKRITK